MTCSARPPLGSSPIPMSEMGLIRVISSVHRSLPVLPKKQTFSVSVRMSQTCQSTKSLRSSPLRGGKNRETGSQLRGPRWRVWEPRPEIEVLSTSLRMELP
jgi:hypothetical protein